MAATPQNLYPGNAPRSDGGLPGAAGDRLAAAQNPQFEHAEPGSAMLILMLIDPAIAILCLFAAATAFGQPFTGGYMILSMLVFSLTFPSARSPQVPRTPELVRYILSNWILIAALLLMLGWVSGTLQAFDPRVLLTWLLVTPPALFVAHRATPAILERVLTAEVAQRKAVVVGANEIGQRLAQRIRENPFHGIRVAGYFDDRRIDRLEGVRKEELLGTLEELPDYVRQHEIDVIYGALPTSSRPQIRELLDSLHDTTASLYFVPDVLAFELIQTRVDTIGGIPVLAVCESPHYGFNRVAKRLSDLVIGSLILLLIMPAMLLIAAGVKLSSPGPALFKQRRYGLDGREIRVYKFRTMTVLEDGDDIRQATENDSRTTRFGAFLRKYSLDELPQFVNVLQGRMSIVGPRPHAIAHNEMYRKVIRGYMIRHKVMPGITGLAQVRGLRGETDTVEKMRARIECDLEYLRKWSLLFDLKIILRTVGVVLSRKNAC